MLASNEQIGNEILSEPNPIDCGTSQASQVMVERQGSLSGNELVVDK